MCLITALPAHSVRLLTLVAESTSQHFSTSQCYAQGVPTLYGIRQQTCGSIPRLSNQAPLVFPVLDQKSLRLAYLLVEGVIILFEMPEALLSE